MNWENFTIACRSTLMDSCKSFQYLGRGLVSEVGEIYGKEKKLIRTDYDGNLPEYEELYSLEVGDCFYYLAMLVDRYGEDAPVSLFDSCKETFEIEDDATERLKEFMDRYADLVFALEMGGAVAVNRFFAESVYWYLRFKAYSVGKTAEQCMVAVIEKLSKRKEHGTITGDGDGDRLQMGLSGVLLKSPYLSSDNTTGEQVAFAKLEKINCFLIAYGAVAIQMVNEFKSGDLVMLNGRYGEFPYFSAGRELIKRAFFVEKVKLFV